MRTHGSGIAAALLLSLLSVTGAHAQNSDLVTAKDPAALADLARGHGSASVAKDNDGDPLIKGRIQGIAYSIYFFGCTDHKDCVSIQFHSGFETDKKPAVSKMNDWNIKKRWAKAYADKDGFPVIEMDVPMSSGIARQTLDETFLTWTSLMKDFATHIGYKVG